MSDDFKVGDIAVKVKGLSEVIPKGTLCRVTAIEWYSGDAKIPPCQVLHFADWLPRKGRNGFTAYNFRKLPPAEPEFISLIRSLGVPKRVREDA